MSGPASFEARISQALNNPTLQVALDRNAERRIVAREQAFGSLPQAEAVRERARAIRIETLARLDAYLEQFAANAERNGARVHWAADADEACAIVLSVVQAATAGLPPGEAPLVAKGKSMVSEEIGLNHALERAGVRAVETDLGEFIVQLRGEAPSHLVTPAVHLRREDVSALFQDRLGMAPTLDVEAMTATARQALRKVFLDAHVGITGVNFGVAETGSLALVSNEGNGRMCATVPRVHVALMGIERLVPTQADLEVMLRVLPRSATGQKITSYVSLLSGPRRPGEPDGPEATHIVLVDNGRSRTLGSELAESLLCIRCGACLNACPVYREIGGHAYGSTYSGPIGAVVSTALFGTDFSQLAHASTLCGACRDACPVRIDIPTMLLAARAQHTAAGQSPAWMRLGMRAWAWAMAREGRYRAAQRLAAAATRLLGSRGRIKRLPGPLGAWTRRKDFPVFAARPFRERWRQREPGRR
jgi:L-lactate dehydrogenase complex protein LldF